MKTSCQYQSSPDRLILTSKTLPVTDLADLPATPPVLIIYVLTFQGMIVTWDISFLILICYTCILGVLFSNKNRSFSILSLSYSYSILLILHPWRHQSFPDSCPSAEWSHLPQWTLCFVLQTLPLITFTCSGPAPPFFCSHIYQHLPTSTGLASQPANGLQCHWHGHCFLFPCFFLRSFLGFKQKFFSSEDEFVTIKLSSVVKKWVPSDFCSYCGHCSREPSCQSTWWWQELRLANIGSWQASESFSPCIVSLTSGKEGARRVAFIKQMP